MITSLFKPAWKSDSIPKRLNAINNLNGNDPQDHDILLELSHDPEPSVREAAIQKITSISRLFELVNTAEDSTTREAADTRLSLLVGVDSSLDEAQYQALLQELPGLAPRLAGQAAIPAARQQALQQLSAEQLLGVLEHTTFTDTRQAIAEKLTDIEPLESARKLLRGKDKNAERIVKEKIDHIHEQQRQLAEQQALVEKLADEAEYLASHDWLPEFKARVAVNRDQWDRIDFTIEASAQQRYQTHRATIDARFEEQHLIDETQKARDELLAELDAWRQSVAGRDLSASITELSASEQRIEEFNTSWRELDAKIAAATPERVKFNDMLQLLQSANELIKTIQTALPESAEPQATAEAAAKSANTTSLTEKSVKSLQSAVKKMHWPKEYGQLKLITELQHMLDQWREQKRAAEKELQQELDRLHKKISSIFRFSKSGNLARARQTYARVEKALDKFAGKDRLKLEERLKEAQETLQKMDDWKDFATEPKYKELCSAMEALADTKLHPDNLSGKIKALQKEWKSLGYSAISDNYWPRFKEASDKAYQPCAEFFEQRHQARQDNLQARQQYVEQMRELLQQTDWDGEPDYKAAQDAVHRISDGLNKIKDVERQDGQKQWKEFAKLRDAVYAKLDEEYEKNIALKQQLIKQMSDLAEADAREENLSTLKMLQTRWKQIGITRRNADQKVWKVFKKQGDIVFNNVKALRKSHKDEIDQQLNSYRAVIKQIEKLAKTATDLADADHRFVELQAEYNALPALPPHLPEKLVHALQREYRNACDRFDDRHQRIIGSLREQEFEALRQKAQLCCELEAINGSADAEQQMHKINAQWDSIELHDSEMSRRIETRRQAALDSIDREEVAAQRRLFCIQLEIATGQESPQEDRQLRMQYQLEQMNKSGLGQPVNRSKNQLEQMEIDWLCMPGAAPEQQQKLDARFRRTLGTK